MKKCLVLIRFTFVISLFGGTGVAQQQELDSLFQQLEDAEGMQHLDLLILISDKSRSTNIPQAITFGNKALEIAKELGDGRKIAEAHKTTSAAYLLKGDYNKAFKHHKLYAEIKDSTLDALSKKQINELQTQYESEKQDDEIKLLKHENQLKELQLNRDKTIVYAVSGGCGGVLILIFLILRSYREKRKTNFQLEAQNAEISKRKEEIESKNKDITDSIRYSSYIQQAILPATEKITNYLSDSFVLYRPRDIVSGDFYWVHKQKDNVLVAVVDCTGHGVPGAFMSIVGNNGLNKAVHEQGLSDPGKILTSLNRSVIETLQGTDGGDVRDGMDIALYNINIRTGELSFSGANNPLYIISKGSLQVLEGERQPIGNLTGQIIKVFNTQTAQLQQRDYIYVFTDGIIDQVGGGQGKKFMAEQLQALLLSIHQLPMNQQEQEISAAIDQWQQEEPQVDDMCLIGVHV